MAEILSPDFPGERLAVCLNPRLVEERARKREDSCRPPKRLFGASPKSCAARAPYCAAWRRASGEWSEANRRKVEKHYDIAVTDDDLTFKRNAGKIAAEARLDGINIVRTSLDAHALDALTVRSAPANAVVGRVHLARSLEDTRSVCSGPKRY